jgi:hypothetical protein
VHRVTRISLVVACVLPVLLVLFAAFAPKRADLPTPEARDTVAAAPLITSITPDTGSVYGGEQVIIRGTGFKGPVNLCAGDYHLWFGTDPAEGFAISPPHFTVLSDDEIAATVPANYGGLVNVQFHNQCGTSAVASPDSFTYLYPDTQCLHGTCSISVGSSQVGRLTHTADGLLNGFSDLSGRGTPQLRSLLDALDIRQWRMDVFNPSTPYGRVFAYCDACRRRTAIDFDLTTDWVNTAGTQSPAYAFAPYADIGSYASLVRDDVARRLNEHQPLSYFDVWNEPYSGTIDAWLSVYGAAYHVIKLLDPSARLIGPSIATFLTASPGQSDTYGYGLDLTDFLNWEMKTGIRYSAISWHENAAPAGALPPPFGSDVPPEPVPGGRRDDWSPAAIGEHVLEARALLANYPPLRGTKLFVNEYGPPWAINIPGWMVGDFAALEDSRADGAMMTCASDSACTSLFDGLIGFDGQPQMPYWVLRAYAQMDGQRLSVKTAASNLFTLAVRPKGRADIELLVGRADDCSTSAQCPQFHAPTAGPVSLKLSVEVPRAAREVAVTLRAFRDEARNPIGHNDVPTEPTARTVRARVVHGRAQIVIPDAGDGDAFYVTLRPLDRSSRR